MTLLHAGTVRDGEKISVAEYGDANLWLEVELSPSWPGRLRQFLSQAPRISLAVRMTKRKQGHGAVSRATFWPMLAAGFLASPLSLNKNEMVDLYTGGPLKRPDAYAIELEGMSSLWNNRIGYKRYRIDSPLGRNSPSELGELKFTADSRSADPQ